MHPFAIRTQTDDIVDFALFDPADNFTVESYEDTAEGVMEKNAEGRDAMTRFTLRPVITFKERSPSAEDFDAMHHSAHEQCYVANSLRGEVAVEGVMRVG